MTKNQCDYIKLVGFFCMVIDHLGSFLFPSELWMRLVGRMSFPLFAYALVEGFRHTSNVERYANRLLLFAVAWQLPYTFFYLKGVVPDHEPVNFLFLLFLGVVMLDSVNKRCWRRACLVTLLAFLLDVSGFPISYGAYGLLMIAAMHFFYGRFALLSVILLGVCASAIVSGFWPVSQILAPLSVVLMAKPYSISWLPRYFFYAAYPAHLLIILGFRLI